MIPKISLFGWMLLACLPGCAQLGSLGLVEEDPGEAYFNQAEVHFQQGRYAEAASAYRSVYTNFPNSPLADKALFKSAYTRSYYKNPSQDISGAVRDLKELISKFPVSSVRPEAQNWLGLLGQIETLKGEKEKLKNDLQRLLDLDIQSEKKRKGVK